MTTAFVSALTGIPVRADVAMTGEITLRGEVTAIGGLKEKLLAAHRGGIKTVMIPEENVKGPSGHPENVKNRLEIVPVKWIDRVLEVALERRRSRCRTTSREAGSKPAGGADVGAATQTPRTEPFAGGRFLVYTAQAHAGVAQLVERNLARLRSRVRDSSPAPDHLEKGKPRLPFCQNHRQRLIPRRGSKAVMHRIANPCRSVRLRPAPPDSPSGLATREALLLRVASPPAADNRARFSPPPGW